MYEDDLLYGHILSFVGIGNRSGVDESEFESES